MTFFQSAITVVVLSLAQATAFAGSWEGQYKGVSGKIGIYAMNSMSITKNTDNDKYTVKFGGERELTYKSAALVSNKIQISDKGYMMYVTVNGDKATVDPDGAVFQRVKK